MTTQALPGALVFGRPGFFLIGDEHSLKEVPDPFPLRGLGPLFDATAYGFRPPAVPRSTAHGRGYWFSVSIDERGLLLKTVELSQDDGVPYPVINGVRPVRRDHFLDAVYENINLKIEFSGAMRVCRRFDRTLPGPTHGRRPFQYRTILDAHFEAGNLVAIFNRTAYFEEFRATYAERLKAEFRRDYADGLAEPEWIVPRPKT